MNSSNSTISPQQVFVAPATAGKQPQGTHLDVKTVTGTPPPLIQIKDMVSTLLVDRQAACSDREKVTNLETSNKDSIIGKVGSVMGKIGSVIGKIIIGVCAVAALACIVVAISPALVIIALLIALLKNMFRPNNVCS